MRASTPLVKPKETQSAGQSSTTIRTIARLVSTDWFRCVVLVSVAILIHSPALQGQRIWDDQYLAHDNPFIKSPILIPESFRHYLFLDSLSAHYRPVQNISYIFDYLFWNTDEFGFHLTNVLLHASSAILLYFLLRKLLTSFLPNRSPSVTRDVRQLRTRWLSLSAFLIALVWVVHPVHSAAVDYISGRADSLAFFFAAAGWLLFIKAEGWSGRFARLAAYGLAATCGMLALLSREIACIWIVLFI